MKYLIVAALITASVLVASILLLGGQEVYVSEGNSSDTDSQVRKSQGADLIIGNPSAKITITEYADFKCPTCNKFTRDIYPELKKKYLDTSKAKIVFRNLPFIAEDSRTAAEGTYCANDQNKFPEYHTLLFTHIWDEYYSKGSVSEGEASAVFSEENLANLVASIGIDTDKFSECLKAGTFKESVSSDLSLSQMDGAVGTPTFFIGGQKIVGAQPFGIFDKLLQVTQN